MLLIVAHASRCDVEGSAETEERRQMLHAGLHGLRRSQAAHFVIAPIQGDELLEGDALLRGAHEGARRDLALSSVEHLPGFARPLVTLLGVESDRGALTNFLAAMVVG